MQYCNFARIPLERTELIEMRVKVFYLVTNQLKTVQPVRIEGIDEPGAVVSFCFVAIITTVTRCEVYQPRLLEQLWGEHRGVPVQKRCKASAPRRPHDSSSGYVSKQSCLNVGHPDTNKNFGFILQPLSCSIFLFIFLLGKLRPSGPQPVTSLSAHPSR